MFSELNRFALNRFDLDTSQKLFGAAALKQKYIGILLFLHMIVNIIHV